MKFLKGHVGWIILTMISSVTLVVILAWTANKSGAKNTKFTRSFLHLKVKPIANITRDKNIVDIASVWDGTIYFTSKDPALIVKMPYNLGKLETIKVNIPDNPTISSAFLTIVEFPKVQILAGNMPGIIITGTNATPKVIGMERSLFSKGINISTSSYIFRGFVNSNATDQVFFKKSVETGVMQADKGIIEGRKDAGISTDGFLSYDKSLHLLTYSFFYQNMFLCLDTNLNLIYKANTIDPNQETKVKAGKAGATYTNLTPSRFINGKSCAENGILYINSKVSSDNEKPAEFNSNSAIDTYEVQTGKYKGSFYIPGFNGERVRSFKIINNHIISLYKSNIVVYEM